MISAWCCTGTPTARSAPASPRQRRWREAWLHPAQGCRHLSSRKFAKLRKRNKAAGRERTWNEAYCHLCAAKPKEVALFINQILLPDLLELRELVHPILCDPARILPRRQRVVHALISQQGLHLIDLKIRGVELMQRRRQLKAEFRRIEAVAIGQDNIHSLAGLPAVYAGRWR